MKIILLAILITLVGCSDSDETKFYLCKEETKVTMKEFSLSCLENHATSLTLTINSFDKNASTSTSRSYSYNDRVKQTFNSFNDRYSTTIKECSYAAKRMFCMEPRQIKEKDDD